MMALSSLGAEIIFYEAGDDFRAIIDGTGRN
jgi:hypothetical protein